MADEDIRSLPTLVSKSLSDIQDGFRKANARTIQDGIYRGPGAVFKLGSGVVFEFKGTAQTLEGGGLLFSNESEAKGTETYIRVPVDVEQPPEGFPWVIAGGGMIFDMATRRSIYKAAIKAIGFLGWADVENSPVWRVGPGQYLVLVAKRGACLALVERNGGEMVGRSEPVPNSLVPFLGPLASTLTELMSRAFGGPEEE